MPSSLPSTIYYVVQTVGNVPHKKILDVGFGRGKYGLILKEYHEDIERIDGVEIFADYVTDVQRAIYNHVYIEDIRTFEPKTRYDLILLIDVIEHLTKEEGLALLQRLQGAKLVSTPNGFYEQGAEHGNDHERHLSGWTYEDFAQFPGAKGISMEPIDSQIMVYIP